MGQKAGRRLPTGLLLLFFLLQAGCGGAGQGGSGDAGTPAASGGLAPTPAASVPARTPVRVELPPAGFDAEQAGGSRGRIQSFTYESKSVGTKRRAYLYTPPGYSREKRYPVLYLLHGIDGDESDWKRYGSPQAILDNLYASGRTADMLVVFPNGRAMKNDRPEGDLYAADKVEAFAAFEQDLVQDLIPYVDAHYPVLPGRENRAVAGLSMGGGQALNFGLGHPDLFAWVGAFSPAPNTKPAEELAAAGSRAGLRLLWISCGAGDPLVSLGEQLDSYLAAAGVPHIWYRDAGGHEWAVWKNGLYQFAQRIFTAAPASGGAEH